MGTMFIANGSQNASTILWSQDIMLTENTTYDLSAWVTSLYYMNPSTLVFEIGDVSLGTLELTNMVGAWQNFSTEFTALTSGPGELIVHDLSTASVGNDFAMDDISLLPRPVPEPTTALLLGLLFLGLVFFKQKRLRFSDRF